MFRRSLPLLADALKEPYKYRLNIKNYRAVYSFKLYNKSGFIRIISEDKIVVIWDIIY